MSDPYINFELKYIREIKFLYRHFRLFDSDIQPNVKLVVLKTFTIHVHANITGIEGLFIHMQRVNHLQITLLHTETKGRYYIYCHHTIDPKTIFCLRYYTPSDI